MAKYPRRGATRQPSTRDAANGNRFDRWLNAAVSLAVVIAMTVGAAAVLAHWLL